MLGTKTFAITIGLLICFMTVCAITPSLMQTVEDRAAKFKVDYVPRDLAVNTGLYDGPAC